MFIYNLSQILSMEEFMSLGYLASGRNPVIMDTSTIVGSFADNNRDKEENLQNKIRFMKMVRRETEKGSRIYVTEKIIDELVRGKKSPEEEEEVSRLVKSIRENGRVLSLDEKTMEVYYYLFKTYETLGIKKGLSLTDYDFLISSMSNACLRKPVIMATNDTKILRSGEIIMKNERIPPVLARAFIKPFPFMFYRGENPYQFIQGTP